MLRNGRFGLISKLLYARPRPFIGLCVAMNDPHFSPGIPQSAEDIHLEPFSDLSRARFGPYILYFTSSLLSVIGKPISHQQPARAASNTPSIPTTFDDLFARYFSLYGHMGHVSNTNNNKRQHQHQHQQQQQQQPPQHSGSALPSSTFHTRYTMRLSPDLVFGFAFQNGRFAFSSCIETYSRTSEPSPKSSSSGSGGGHHHHHWCQACRHSQATTQSGNPHFYAVSSINTEIAIHGGNFTAASTMDAVLLSSYQAISRATLKVQDHWVTALQQTGTSSKGLYSHLTHDITSDSTTESVNAETLGVAHAAVDHLTLLASLIYHHKQTLRGKGPAVSIIDVVFLPLHTMAPTVSLGASSSSSAAAARDTTSGTNLQPGGRNRSSSSSSSTSMSTRHRTASHSSAVAQRTPFKGYHSVMLILVSTGHIICMCPLSLQIIQIQHPLTQTWLQPQIVREQHDHHQNHHQHGTRACTSLRTDDGDTPVLYVPDLVCPSKFEFTTPWNHPDSVTTQVDGSGGFSGAGHGYGSLAAPGKNALVHPHEKATLTVIFPHVHCHMDVLAILADLERCIVAPTPQGSGLWHTTRVSVPLMNTSPDQPSSSPSTNTTMTTTTPTATSPSPSQEGIPYVEKYPAQMTIHSQPSTTEFYTDVYRHAAMTAQSRNTSPISSNSRDSMHDDTTMNSTTNNLSLNYYNVKQKSLRYDPTPSHPNVKGYATSSSSSASNQNPKQPRFNHTYQTQTLTREVFNKNTDYTNVDAYSFTMEPVVFSTENTNEPEVAFHPVVDSRPLKGIADSTTVAPQFLRGGGGVSHADGASGATAAATSSGSPHDTYISSTNAVALSTVYISFLIHPVTPPPPHSNAVPSTLLQSPQAAMEPGTSSATTPTTAAVAMTITPDERSTLYTIAPKQVSYHPKVFPLITYLHIQPQIAPPRPSYTRMFTTALLNIASKWWYGSSARDNEPERVRVEYLQHSIALNTTEQVVANEVTTKIVMVKHCPPLLLYMPPHMATPGPHLPSSSSSIPTIHHRSGAVGETKQSGPSARMHHAFRKGHAHTQEAPHIQQQQKQQQFLYPMLALLHLNLFSTLIYTSIALQHQYNVNMYDELVHTASATSTMIIGAPGAKDKGYTTSPSPSPSSSYGLPYATIPHACRQSDFMTLPLPIISQKQAALRRNIRANAKALRQQQQRTQSTHHRARGEPSTTQQQQQHHLERGGLAPPTGSAGSAAGSPSSELLLTHLLDSYTPAFANRLPFCCYVDTFHRIHVVNIDLGVTMHVIKGYNEPTVHWGWLVPTSIPPAVATGNAEKAVTPSTLAGQRPGGPGGSSREKDDDNRRSSQPSPLSPALFPTTPILVIATQTVIDVFTIIPVFQKISSISIDTSKSFSHVSSHGSTSHAQGGRKSDQEQSGRRRSTTTTASDATTSNPPISPLRIIDISHELYPFGESYDNDIQALLNTYGGPSFHSGSEEDSTTQRDPAQRPSSVKPVEMEETGDDPLRSVNDAEDDAHHTRHAGIDRHTRNTDVTDQHSDMDDSNRISGSENGQGHSRLTPPSHQSQDDLDSLETFHDPIEFDDDYDHDTQSILGMIYPSTSASTSTSTSLVHADTSVPTSRGTHGNEPRGTMAVSSRNKYTTYTIINLVVFTSYGDLLTIFLDIDESLLLPATS